MAIRAQRRTLPHLRVVGDKTVGGKIVDPAQEVDAKFDNGFKPPKQLNKRESALWDGVVRRAAWLTEFDIPRAYMWANLQARFFQNPTSFNGYLIGQLRALGSELGFDPASRTRMKTPDHAKSKTSKYFS